ncbi:MAG: response regulator, partial [Candidatus Obscuribacterales bacterium]|nr:response regulator [Candidatus Obscuribacterales bacterium]
MQNLTALVLDPNTYLQREFVDWQIQNITLCTTASAEQLSDSLTTGPVDLIMLDMELPGITGLALMAELRKQKPGIPIILLSAKAPTEEDWISVASEPQVEIMQTPITFGKLMYHLSRLFKKREPLADLKRHKIIVKPVDELRNDNGRLDALLVSRVFDLSMTDIAANVGISRQALSKTPDSLSIQPALRQFERIAR